MIRKGTRVKIVADALELGGHFVGRRGTVIKESKNETGFDYLVDVDGKNTPAGFMESELEREDNR